MEKTPILDPDNFLRRRFSQSNSDLEEEEEEEITTQEKVATRAPSTLRKILTRTLFGWLLIGLYLLILRAGHLYCIISVIICQIECFRELVNVRYVDAKELRLPLFRTTQWSWFLVALLYVYGETLHDFWSEREQMPYITQHTKYLNYLVFSLYCAVFISTVLTFKKSLIRYQISQMFWTIVTIALVVIQCKYFAANALNGLFWFIFPMSNVVMNDVAAYFVGISLGRKFIKAPFLSISPNKTWEGFIGAGVITLFFSFFFPALLSQWSWLTCPAEGIFLKPFPPPLSCKLNPIFVARLYSFDNLIPFGPPSLSVMLRPIQLHGLAYGIFASLVSPFGGSTLDLPSYRYLMVFIPSFVC